MNAHFKIDTDLTDVASDPFSARALAKEWRAYPERRDAIVQQIDAQDRWEQFRWSRDGELIARITEEERARINGASCRVMALAGGQRVYRGDL